MRWRKEFKMHEIIILCPWGVQTGGPEAIHQLSDELISLGFNASIFYTTNADFEALQTLTSNGTNLDAIDIPERINNVELYKKYQTNSVKSIKFNRNTLVVLPETYLNWQRFFKRNTSLIWWLSVDNAFSYLDMMKINLNSIKEKNIHHAYQSNYAKNFLNAIGIKNLSPLSDYTPEGDLKNEYEKNIITMSALPHKVHIDVDHFKKEIENHCNIEVRLLRGMSREQVYDALDHSLIYIDFGNFPGKDRMPREALIRDCCLITSDAGAAGYNEFCIPEEYILSTSSPQLIKHACKNILTNFPLSLERYELSKRKIMNEKYIFSSEIFNLFKNLLT